MYFPSFFVFPLLLKKYFSLFKYYPPFPSPFVFSSTKKIFSFSKYFFLLFLLCIFFYSSKDVFSLSNYFPHFPSPFCFSRNKNIFSSFSFSSAKNTFSLKIFSSSSSSVFFLLYKKHIFLCKCSPPFSSPFFFSSTNKIFRL